MSIIHIHDVQKRIEDINLARSVRSTVSKHSAAPSGMTWDQTTSYTAHAVGILFVAARPAASAMTSTGADAILPRGVCRARACQDSVSNALSLPGILRLIGAMGDTSCNSKACMLAANSGHLAGGADADKRSPDQQVRAAGELEKRRGGRHAASSAPLLPRHACRPAAPLPLASIL